MKRTHLRGVGPARRALSSPGAAAGLARVLAPLLSVACVHGGSDGSGAASARGPREDTSLRVAAAPGRPAAEVGASFWWPPAASDRGRRPIAVLVPGAGRVSRVGRQPGDGVARYAEPVEVTRAWAEALAEGGMGALAFDKRTCRPADDRLCRPVPSDDFDSEGPGALSRDIDAACALARGHPRGDGRVVLLAHGQGVAPALASACAREAAALVLLAPIPRGIDEVMVAARQHGAREPGLDPAERTRRKNAAGSLEATFRALGDGAFAADARLQGATVAFWQRWISLTRQTPELLARIRAPRLLVLGGADDQFAPIDRDAIRAWAKRPGISLLEVAEADHHLVQRGAVATARVVAALGQALGGGPREPGS